MIFVETLQAGPEYTLQVVVKDGACAVINFIRDELPPAERAKVDSFLEYIAEHGPPRNEERFRHEGNGIYALKAGTVRIYGFFDGQRRITLTHGFRKHARGGKKVQSREREQAERVRKALFAERAGKGEM